MRKFFVTLLVATALIPRMAHAWVEIEGPHESTLKLGALLHPQFTLLEEPAGTTDRTVRFVPMVRRARILLAGEVNATASFFMQTDIANVGANGDWTPRLYILDALADFNLHPALQVDAGLFIVPTSHIAMQGATNLLGIDYPQLVVQQPASITNAKGADFPSTEAWRDVGIMVRGMVIERHLEYRLAASQGLAKFVGASIVNPHAVPRFTGRLTYNVFEPEAAANAGGVFYSGATLDEQEAGVVSSKRVLAFGASASYEPKAIALPGNKLAAYQGYNADAFVDWPLLDGTHSINGQLDYFYYTEGSTRQPTSALFFEGGYRFNRWQPLAAVEWVHVHHAGVADQTYWRLGVNYWLAAHRANIKLDAGARRLPASGRSAVFVARVQGQIFF